MARQETFVLLNQAAPTTLKWLPIAEKACLAIVGLISGSILCGWLVPDVGSTLPDGWSLMKANTSFALVLITLSLFFEQSNEGNRWLIVKRICAAIVILIASSALVAHLSGFTFGVETLLAADSSAEMPGRMSLHTAVCLILISFTLLLAETRHKTLAFLGDNFTVALLVMIVVVAFGYLFDATKLFGHSTFTRMSP